MSVGTVSPNEITAQSIPFLNEQFDCDSHTIRDIWERAGIFRPPASSEIYSNTFRLANGILLRKHYNEEPLSLCSSLEDSQKRFDVARLHFNKLKALGMSIVSFAQSPDDGDGIIGYSASKFIPQSQSLDTLSIDPDDPTLIKHVQAPLRRYLEWIKVSKQEYYLSDLYAERQYSYSSELGVFFLHDIDPQLSDTSHRSKTIDYIMRDKIDMLVDSY